MIRGGSTQRCKGTCKSNVYTPKLPHSYTPFNLSTLIIFLRNRGTKEYIAALLCGEKINGNSWIDYMVVHVSFIYI